MHTYYMDCSSYHCPHIKAMLDAGKSPRIRRDDALRDATGTCWCHACTVRSALMNYGAAHGYPALAFPPYAVGGGQALWRTLAALGTPACIEAWVAALGLDGQEDDDALQSPTET